LLSRNILLSQILITQLSVSFQEPELITQLFVFSILFNSGVLFTLFSGSIFEQEFKIKNNHIIKTK